MATELYHHGILGMKWGVRRYQNYDGTLTEAGKKHISAEYKKESEKGMSEWNKNFRQTYVDAYNEAVDAMNNGGIEKYNAEQKEKYGKDYARRSGYEEEYIKIFDSLIAKNINQKLDSFYKTNPNIKKALALAEEYKMTEWDDLAKTNAKLVAEVRDALEHNQNEQNELYHHGILGMKWGVRRYQNEDGTLTEAGRKRYGDEKDTRDASKKSYTTKKERNNLTEAQLDALIKRLEKETKLRDLEKKNEDTGKAYVADLLKEIGKRTIPTLIAGGVLYGVKAGLGLSFDPAELGKAMFNGGAAKK